MGVHDGHRERLKLRFQKEGLGSFQDHNALELLLFYSVPRIDTNPMAHDLINTFGGFSKVFEAETSELLKVKGIGIGSCALIKLIPELSNLLMESDHSGGDFLDSKNNVNQYFLDLFKNAQEDSFVVVYTDVQNKVLAKSKFYDYWGENSKENIREIVEIALHQKASRLMICCKLKDIINQKNYFYDDFMKDLRQALEVLDIVVIDNLVVHDGSVFSI